MHLALTNVPIGQGDEMAQGLVSAGHAACVNIISGVRSVYIYDGALCDDREETLLIKVAEGALDGLRQAVLDAHPYSLPEFVVVPVDGAASS